MEHPPLKCELGQWGKNLLELGLQTEPHFVIMHIFGARLNN